MQPVHRNIYVWFAAGAEEATTTIYKEHMRG